MKGELFPNEKRNNGYSELCERRMRKLPGCRMYLALSLLFEAKHYPESNLEWTFQTNVAETPSALDNCRCQQSHCNRRKKLYCVARNRSRITHPSDTESILPSAVCLADVLLLRPVLRLSRSDVVTLLGSSTTTFGRHSWNVPDNAGRGFGC